MKMRTIQYIGLMMLAACLTVACRESTKGQGSGVDESDSTEVTGFFDTHAAEAAREKQTQTKKSDRPKKMEIPAELKGRPDMLLVRDAYYVSYNKDWRIPNWVAWHLTKAHTYGDNDRTEMEFREDTEVPMPRATDEDYYDSRYDRGHMCPSGDNKWDRRAQIQSFLFTNVCPQNHGMNKGEWNDLEMQCRDWARQFGELYIVAGPVFYDGVKKTIGRHKVAVPDAFFKVVLCTKNYAKAIAFLVPNKGNKGGRNNLHQYVVPIDSVERLTGIDFLPSLKDDTEQRVEASDHDDMVKDWNVPVRYYYERRSSGGSRSGWRY